MNTYLRCLLHVHACLSLTRSSVESKLRRFGITIDDWQSMGQSSAGTAEFELDYESTMQCVESLSRVRRISFELAIFGNETFTGERWVFSPKLGLGTVQIDQAGNQMLSELNVTTILRLSGDNVLKIERALRLALLTQWDDEFEELREQQMSQRRSLPRVG